MYTYTIHILCIARPTYTTTTSVRFAFSFLRAAPSHFRLLADSKLDTRG